MEADSVRAVAPVSPEADQNCSHPGGSKNEKPNFAALYSRLINFGIAYSDLERIAAVATDWISFGREMANLAELWMRQADKGWRLGQLETPRAHWKRAADYYHYAQLKLPDSLLKESFRRASRKCYEKAAVLLDPPAVRYEIPFQSTSLPGYLRAKEPGAPCVILIGGLDSAKEVELHYFAETFLGRECSVFFFDGPGQGELYGKESMACGFEHVIAAVIQFLRNDARVGSAALGCFGVALGGYFACRAAALNPEIEACISIGGFFDSRVLPRLPALAQSMCLTAFGLPSDSDLAELTPHFNLAALEARRNTPLLLVHGTADHLVDTEQITALRKWAHGPVDALIFEGSEHVCCDRFNECLPLMGDWMTSSLLRKDTKSAPFTPRMDAAAGQPDTIEH